jgi:hypothetical protein
MRILQTQILKHVDPTATVVDILRRLIDGLMCQKKLKTHVKMIYAHARRVCTLAIYLDSLPNGLFPKPFEEALN